MIPMNYPHGIEYAYRRELLTLVGSLRRAVKAHLAPVVPRMVQEATNRDLPTGPVRTDEIRQDLWQDDLTDALHKIAEVMMTPQNEAIREMRTLGPRVSLYNKEEWQRLIRSQYGVDPTAEDPERFAELLEKWADTNASLIQDIPGQTIIEIGDRTVEALRSGQNPDDTYDAIMRTLSDRADVSESRARLIARDQVAKLNGNFTQHRQRDLGVVTYIWRTVGDERVRESHQDADGHEFNWDDPPDVTDGNHPGEDYQCRCWAEPVLPEVMEFEASLLEMEPA